MLSSMRGYTANDKFVQEKMPKDNQNNLAKSSSLI